MTVHLFAHSSFPLDEIAARLQDEDCPVVPVRLKQGVDAPELAAVIQAVVIVRESGMQEIGERVARVRHLIGAGVPLTVCAPWLIEKDRATVRQCGANDFIAPAGWQAELVATRILAHWLAQADVQGLGALCGATLAMRQMFERMREYANSSAPVLILGETGTGKELIAKALHEQGPRSKAELVKVNCASVQRELFESEFFGHVKGSFTGAHQDRIGRFQLADGGTLLLDEVGEIPYELQSKLLRVLQESEFEPVGSSKTQRVNVRVLAATNRDLQEEVYAGRFREDLLYRLCTFPLVVPPLRDRLADLPLLVQHFLKQRYPALQPVPLVSPHALDCLFEHDWRGNVRDLQAIVERAVMRAGAQAAEIRPEHWQEALQQSQSLNWRRKSTGIPKGLHVPYDPATDAWPDMEGRLKRLYFEALLKHTNGDKKKAIELSGLKHTRFYEILKELKTEGDAPAETG